MVHVRIDSASDAAAERGYWHLPIWTGTVYGMGRNDIKFLKLTRRAAEIYYNLILQTYPL